jgi:hypothetical protein
MDVRIKSFRIKSFNMDVRIKFAARFQCLYGESRTDALLYGGGETCRDSQAIASWILSNMRKYMKRPELMRIWIEAAEAYWSQFIWSPWHPHYRDVRLNQKIELLNHA